MCIRDRLTEEAIVSTVTGSDQYKEDLAAIVATGSGPEFVVGTQTSYTACLLYTSRCV